MKTLSFMFGLIILLSSCKTEPTKQKSGKVTTNVELLVHLGIPLTISEPDTLNAALIKDVNKRIHSGEATKVMFPSKSICGGNLFGYKAKGNWIYVQGRNEGEYGYVQKEAYFSGEFIDLIIETIHTPAGRDVAYFDDNDKYEESPTEFDHEIRYVTFDPEDNMRIFRNEKEIYYYPESHDMMLLENIRCVEQMLIELNTIQK